MNARTGCTIDLTATSIAIAGHPLANFELATLRAALGEPDRHEQVSRQGWYEESDEDGGRGTSDPYTAIDHHYVYDALGIVFHTANGMHESAQDPTQLRIFFAAPRTYDNVATPPAIPKQRGACRVTIAGQPIDPAADLRPPAIDYRTPEFTLWGLPFGSTSIAMAIDSVYFHGERRAIQIFLDAPSTGRASYIEVK